MNYQSTTDYDPRGDGAMAKPRYLFGALIGGALMGIPSGLPLVGCCCMLWGIVGGFVAAYIAARPASSFAPTEGGIAGLAAAGWGILICTVLSAVFNLLFAGVAERLASQDFPDDAPPELTRWFEEMQNSNSIVAFLITTAFVAAILLVCSGLGGLIAGAVFKKGQQ